MKKLVIKSFLLILPLIIISLPCDIYLSKRLSKNKTHAEGELLVWNDIYSGSLNEDILIYGASTAWVHVNPEIISDSLNLDAYNLGIDGHSFQLEYFRHLELLKYNKPPKEIILIVDPFTLSRRKDLYNSDQFLPYLLWDKDVKKATEDYNGFDIFDYYVPMVRYFGDMKSISAAFSEKQDERFIRNKGFRGMDAEWSSEYIDEFKLDLDSSSILLVDKFIINCKKMGIGLSIVISPQYYKTQKLITNREDMISIFKKFSIQYKLDYLDCSSDIIAMNRAYFYNAMHLNLRGSLVFTNMIVKMLKNKPKGY